MKNILATHILFNAVAKGLSAVLLIIGTSSLSIAADWPDRPVKIISPYLAGGGLDIWVRPVANLLTQQLGQSFVVENKAGANGAIGTTFGARSAPDGYTIMAATTGSLAMNAAIKANLPYDPIKDFVPVTIVAESAFLMTAAPSSSIKSLKDVIERSIKQPGSVTYASFGIGSSAHLAAELFSAEAGIKMTHVPYQGSAQAIQDVMAGNVMVMFDSLSLDLPHIRAGRLVPIALADTKRSAAAPDVPTFAELGLPKVLAGSWYALLAPTGTPAAIVQRLRDEVVKALASKTLQDQANTTGTRTVGNTPAEFAQQLKEDLEKWRTVVKKIGLENLGG
ncbi:MAG: tripartite tricarboxylate transporter substrate binding protein [Alcaligenaceae bacterium]|jgi:tripartite-type tricarboxylate transporter receptor subunit TctC